MELSWEPGVTISLSTEFHSGETVFNLNATNHTKLIDLTVKSGAALTVVDPVRTSAVINGNVFVSDDALRISLEAGSTMSAVPLDTSGAATVYISCANTTQASSPHTWILHKGNLSSVTSTVNISSTVSITIIIFLCICT
jgi:hypothetical protein